MRFRFDVAIGYLYSEAHTLKMTDSDDATALDGQRIWKLQDALHISAGFAITLPRIHIRRLEGGLLIALTEDQQNALNGSTTTRQNPTIFQPLRPAIMPLGVHKMSLPF